MPELVVRDLPETVVQELERRATEHGVTPEEEHRQILQKVLNPVPKFYKEDGSEYTLFDHLEKLGEIAPDIDFTPVRKRSEPRDLNL